MLFVAMPQTKRQRAMLGDESMFHNALHKYPVDVCLFVFLFFLLFIYFPACMLLKSLMGGYLIKTEIKIVLHISHFLTPSFVKNFGQRGHTETMLLATTITIL